jgi:integrase
LAASPPHFLGAFNMARRISKDFTKVNGERIAGVWRNARGYYVRNVHKDATDKREFFRCLDEAIERRDELAGIQAPLIRVRRDAEPATDELLSLGIDPEAITPEVVVALARRTTTTVNPEYPDRQHAAWIMVMQALGRSTEYREYVDFKSPSRFALTVTAVGRSYAEWYLSERENVGELKHRADSHNAVNGARGKRRKLPVDYARPTVRQNYREAIKHMREFAKIVGDKPISALMGSDFVTYRDAITKASTDPNNRFRLVKAAFRRAMKLHPDENWKPQMTMDGGWLSILECRGTTTASTKTIITPQEFQALLNAADTQWRAILWLSLNCALANSDVSEIRWRHLDLENGVMFFPRTKNGRLRQTPLLPATIQALNEWRSQCRHSSADDNCFKTWQGTRWITSTNSITKHWKILQAKCEADGAPVNATFRALRKSGPTVIMASSVRDKQLAIDMLLGHSPNKTWRFYVGFAPDFLTDAVQEIGRKYGM